MKSETILADYIDSKRASNALLNAGVKTVGDLSLHNLAELSSIKGVGERTIEQLKELVPTLPEDAEDNGEIEEGKHSLFIISPHDEYSLHLLPGERVPSGIGGGFKLIPAMFLKCVDGRGELKRETWLLRKYRRDVQAAEDHVRDGKPWRAEAAEWLMSRKNHGIKFRVMTD